MLDPMTRFTHLRTPLNKFTFKMPQIRRWVESMAIGRTLNLFSGEVELDIDEIRNDIRPEMKATYHMDALEFAQSYAGKPFDTVLLDPPYSYRKSMEMYEGKVRSPFNALKDALCPIITPMGRVITFGYHSVSMGRSRGFEVSEICIMSHGGAIHDTIATVEDRQKDLC